MEMSIKPQNDRLETTNQPFKLRSDRYDPTQWLETTNQLRSYTYITMYVVLYIVATQNIDEVV